MATIVTSFLTHGQDNYLISKLTLGNYFSAFNFIYIRVFLHSLAWSLLTTFICLLLAYPFAYFIARCRKEWRLFFLFLMIIPFWTSSLIRAYALMTILKANGILNHYLLLLHIIDKPLQILYTPFAVELGLVYSLLPFMVLPIYANLEKFDWRLLEAAHDLGAGFWRAFFQVILPVSLPGVVSGALLVFLPAMTLFFIPDILGGAKSFLLGNLIKYTFLENANWPLGAVFSTLLLLLLSIVVLILRRFRMIQQQGIES